MESIYLELGIMAVLVILSGFFSASETALTAVSRARLFTLIQQGVRRAAIAEKLRHNKDALMGTVLLGNTLLNIATASLATVLALKLLGEEYGPFAATFFTTFVLLIFAEMLPKVLAFHRAESVSLLVSPLLLVFQRMLYPLTLGTQWIVRGVLQLFGINLAQSKNMMSAADALRGTIDMHHHEGEVEKDDRDMLSSILDLSERTVEEVMLHRSKVESLDIGLDPEELISRAIAINHSRLPLWKDNPENIIGVLYFKDLLRLVRTQKIGITREMIRRIAHKPWFVPETTPLDDQLDAFRSARKHFACVVDEYGAWLGIVTLEDIIEEIVGEIDDEHDPLMIADIMPFGEHAHKVAGGVTIRDLNRHLDWDLPDDHASTVAGLVLHEARVIPDVGATFEFFGYRFTVIEKRVNQITQLVIQALDDPYDDVQE
jgi:Mg2+/Co2+ transporter CorB